jgi:hypothetical protein
MLSNESGSGERVSNPFAFYTRFCAVFHAVLSCIKESPPGLLLREANFGKAPLMPAPNKHTGSSFDAFLEEEGVRDEVAAAALRRVLAWQLAQPAQEEPTLKSRRGPG